MGAADNKRSMRLKIISLILFLSFYSPVRSDQGHVVPEEDGNISEDMEAIVDMLNTIEDGGYGRSKPLVDYDYSQDGGLEIVLDTEVSFTDREGEDYPLNYDDGTDKEDHLDEDLPTGEVHLDEDEPNGEEITEPEDGSKDMDLGIVDKDDESERFYDYDKSSEISETIVGNDDDLNEDFLVKEYQDDEYENLEEAKMIQVTMDDLYDQSMIFHIILLLGICLICVVVFFALVTLMVTVLTRRHYQHSNVVRSVKIKSDGIVKSYAKIPVEIKNMVPSNIAYKQLYDV